MLRYFLDENLSDKLFSQILQLAGIALSTSAELGYRGTPDYIWIPEVTAAGFVIVSADQHLRYRPIEKQALIRANARVVIVKVKGTVTMEKSAHNFVNSQQRLERMAARETAPWLVHLNQPSAKDFARSKPGRLSDNKLAR